MSQTFAKIILTLSLLYLCAGQALFAADSPSSVASILQQQAPNLPVKVLQAGLHAYYYGLHKGDIKNHQLAIVDMAIPSSAERLWVFDMDTHKVLFNTYAAHAEATGGLYAKFFSNAINSKETSLGIYITGKEYYGHHGQSLYLNGMEPGFNNNAAKRDVVIHGASYVSKLFIHAHHRLGRSWGCVAVNFNVVKPLINTLKNGAMLMIYYPQQAWLSHSEFLNGRI
jgi:hypothetical protein